MSRVVCHVDLVQRGAIAAAARLVDQRKSASWVFTSSGGDEAPRESVLQLSRWINQQLAASSGDADLILCLDVEQATCGWVTSNGLDDKSIKAAVREAQSGEREDAGQVTPANWLRVGEVDADLSVQALTQPILPAAGKKAKAVELAAKPNRAAAAKASGKHRIAVIALPDLASRVLVDELDRVDQPVLRILTLWHAMAQAWDPGSREDGDVLAAGDGQRVVAEDVGCTASVMLDPRGRLLWTWQQGGHLLCAGSMRLPIARVTVETPADPARGPDAAPTVIEALEVSASEIARITTDWLAWSTQLGLAPSIVSVIGTEAVIAPGATNPPGGAAEPDVGPQAVASALAARWPGTTVAAVVEPNPIEQTLRRAALTGGNSIRLAGIGEGTVDPRTAMVELASRSGKGSRGAYRWAAAAIASAALVLLTLCVRVALAAKATAAELAKVEAERKQLLTALQPLAPDITSKKQEANPAGYLKKLADDREKERKAIVPEKPILAELERLMLAVSQVPGVLTKGINAASTTGFMANFDVPNASSGGQILEKLAESAPKGGEYILWSGSDSVAGDKFTFSASGRWTGEAGTGAKPAAIGTEATGTAPAAGNKPPQPKSPQGKPPATPAQPAPVPPSPAPPTQPTDVPLEVSAAVGKAPGDGKAVPTERTAKTFAPPGSGADENGAKGSETNGRGAAGPGVPTSAGGSKPGPASKLPAKGTPGTKKPDATPASGSGSSEVPN